MPDKSDRKLWHRLEGYSFHERPLRRSLVDRLHDETGHSIDICYTLVEEYRRFMYLAGSTSEPLSPSPIIGLVWRMHMADTRAYFQDFCPRIIGRTIDYTSDLPAFYEDPAYTLALERYAEEFGRPLAQFWPDPDVAAVRLSTGLLVTVGIAAFGLAIFLMSFLFVVFGLVVIGGSIFLHWKFSSLPLHNTAARED